MKKTITLALALFTCVSIAQPYNNTYDVNANNDNLAPHFVIANDKGESITVSYGSDAPTEPRTDYFILTRHDASGTVMYNNRIDPAFATNDGITNVEALYFTKDDGLLVAGYYYDNSDYVEQPFLVKVDKNGFFQWSRIYYVNQKHMENSQYEKISLCRVFDDADENYFIVASGDSDHNPGSDITTNVIKVDNNGKMIFTKKYYDQNPNPFNQLREYPADIEYSKNKNMYMITGRRIEYSPAKDYLMYFFGIDNNGKVVTSSYRTLESKSNPSDIDMIYDPAKDWFAVTFTHAKSLYIPGYASQIGFLSIDPSMSIFNPLMLWHDEAIENNGRSISLCKNGEYVICSDILDNTVSFDRNPAWLRIDNAGNPVTNLFRYNIKDEVLFGHHVTTVNPNTGDEEFVLVNEQKLDLRVIRTDMGGKSCGFKEFKPKVDKYEPKITDYTYDYEEHGKDKEYKVKEKMSDPKVRKCEDDASSYRPAGETGIAQLTASGNAIAVYPSVLSSDNARLTVENSSGTAVKLEVRSITGQLVYLNSQVASGKTEVLITGNGSLSEGLYLLKIYDANGSLNTSSKIVISK